MGARAVQEHSNQKCRHSSAATSASTAVAGVASLAAVNSDATGKKKVGKKVWERNGINDSMAVIAN